MFLVLFGQLVPVQLAVGWPCLAEKKVLNTAICDPGRTKPATAFCRHIRTVSATLPAGIASPVAATVLVTSIGRSRSWPDGRSALSTSPDRSGLIDRTASAGTDSDGRFCLWRYPSRNAVPAVVPAGTCWVATRTDTAFWPAIAR